MLIFGGTFDPPHHAHVALPRAAAHELGCRRILYVPAAINPLKVACNLPAPTAAHHRLAMLRLALDEAPRAEISDMELNREGASYTIETLRELSASERGGLFLLIGADQALDFHRWKDWREILLLARPAVLLRPPWTRESFAAELHARYDDEESRRWLDWTLRTPPLLDISATQVRERIRRGQPVGDLVSPAVEAYIRQHRLYEAG